MHIRTKIIGFLLTVSSAFTTNNAAANNKPLWEIGVGAGGVSQSYYIGSNQQRNMAFPVIFPVYRGDFFKSDNNGLRAELIKNPLYKLDLSFDFNFAIKSDEIELRRGMSDIGNLLQVGPSLEITLKKDKSQWLQMNFPTRAAITIEDGSFDYSGYIFSPGLSYLRYFSIAKKPLRLGLYSELKFGSADYHDIYYGVDEQFATANRPRYMTSSGYSGYRLTASLTYKSKKQLFSLFTRYDNISDAVFNDSPLVETDDNFTTGFLFAYYIFKSKALASN